MSHRMKKPWILAALLVLVLTACNLTNTNSDPQAFYTQAAETMSSAQTQTAALAPPTAESTLTSEASPSLEMTNTPLITITFTPGGPTNTLIPIKSPQPTQGQSNACDNALFVKDINYPDYSVIAPGTTFVKTWRFKNLGPCTWDKDYHIVFSYVTDTGKNGIFTPPAPAEFGVIVEPGDEVDLSITITAPTKLDGYIVYFRLQNDKGFFFGPEFWVIFSVE